MEWNDLFSYPVVGFHINTIEHANSTDRKLFIAIVIIISIMSYHLVISIGTTTGSVRIYIRRDFL
jgi:hypothetical protein